MEQDKQEQLKSYMNLLSTIDSYTIRLPPPTQAEEEAIRSYSGMFLALVCQYDK